MKVGDLIKFEPDEGALFSDDMEDHRQIGTVLNFDIYRGSKTYGEPIIEVLWNTGNVEWILKRYVEAVDESR